MRDLRIEKRGSVWMVYDSATHAYWLVDFPTREAAQRMVDAVNREGEFRRLTKKEREAKRLAEEAAGIEARS